MLLMIVRFRKGQPQWKSLNDCGERQLDSQGPSLARASGKIVSLSLWTKNLSHLLIHTKSGAGARTWGQTADLPASSWSYRNCITLRWGRALGMVGSIPPPKWPLKPQAKLTQGEVTQDPRCATPQRWQAPSLSLQEPHPIHLPLTLLALMNELCISL